AQAALMVGRSAGDRSEALPDVRVRIQPVKPGHERFLHGTVLRGPSGTGALAMALNGLYVGLAPLDSRLAVSFALSAPGTSDVDGSCHAVGGADEKVRACAKQGIARVLVAKEQHSQIALYGYKHGIEILGAATFAEAAALAVGPMRDHPATPLHVARRIVLLY